MDTQQIQNFLTQISAINRQFETIAELTGENFNIFKILKLAANEVRTHSAFLAELLNPNGTHGRGTVFIREFVEMLKVKAKILHNDSTDKENLQINFDSENVKKVEVERWLGYKSDIAGGYIDILLTDNKTKHIIIENKIYAVDQENQLQRYHQFDPSAPLVYLTLNGKCPSNLSTSDEKEIEEIKANLICISYQDDILEWLKSCKKYTVDHPLLRETFSQYINLIKHLTHQTMKDDEKAEIVSTIIKNKDYIDAIEELIDNNIWNETLKTIMYNFGKQILGENGIGKDLMMKEVVENDFLIPKSFGESGFAFYFYKEKWKYCIYFCFADDYQNIYYGIDTRDNKATPRESAPKDKFNKELGSFGESIPDPLWIWKTHFIEYNDMSWFDLNNKGKKLFKDKIEAIEKQLMKIDHFNNIHDLIINL